MDIKRGDKIEYINKNDINPIMVGTVFRVFEEHGETKVTMTCDNLYYNEDDIPIGAVTGPVCLFRKVER